MLGWLLLGAFLTVAVITIAVSYLNRNTAARELRNRDILKGKIKDIVKSGSITHIKMDAIKDDGEEVEVDFETEDYDSYQIRRGIEIYT